MSEKTMVRTMAERCGWVGQDPLYVDYHDTEWGVPQHDSRVLFETLVLESFQSGLSWLTILKKREGFRKAFAGFDAEAIAGWGDSDVARLLADPGIVRHRGKIRATIANAKAWVALERDPGFSAFLWNFVDGSPLQNRFTAIADIPSETPLSKQISSELKKRGFTFCGPKTVYAFMQAAGMVNDHVVDCPCYERTVSLGRECKSQ